MPHTHCHSSSQLQTACELIGGSACAPEGEAHLCRSLDIHVCTGRAYRDVPAVGYAVITCAILGFLLWAVISSDCLATASVFNTCTGSASAACVQRLPSRLSQPQHQTGQRADLSSFLSCAGAEPDAQSAKETNLSGHWPTADAISLAHCIAPQNTLVTTHLTQPDMNETRSKHQRMVAYGQSPHQRMWWLRSTTAE